jgi:hypothetical protein
MTNQNNNYLDEKEIDELKNIFIKICRKSTIDKYSKKIYNLFVNDILFEPNDNIDDYLYYLGYYYSHTEINYALMKKYYLMAIDKGNSLAMHNLGYYYEIIEKNYDLMKKYYHMAIDKGREASSAMYNLGYYYEQIEGNYELMKKYYLMAIDNGNSEAMYNLGEYYRYTEKDNALMKKYYLMAIDNGNSEAMNSLGCYYNHTEINYNLMEKYYLQAIDKGSWDALNNFDYFCIKNMPTIDMLRNYLFAVIKGNFGLKYINIFNINDQDFQNYLLTRVNEPIENNNNNNNIKLNIDTNKNHDIYCMHVSVNLFCEIIDHNNLHFDDFKYCTEEIIRYLNSKNKCIESKNVEHFMKYISKLYYGISKKNIMYKEYFKNEFKLINSVSQLFIEYLDFYYYKYVEKKYAPFPPGKGYIKTKKHFEILAKTQKNGNTNNNRDNDNNKDNSNNKKDDNKEDDN